MSKFAWWYLELYLFVTLSASLFQGQQHQTVLTEKSSYPINLKLCRIARNIDQVINISLLLTLARLHQEDGAGYSLFWSGTNNDERCLCGVGIMIKTSIARKLQNLPVGHSDRTMSLRLPIQDNKFATVFSLYAPSLQTETGVKEGDLHKLLQHVDSKDKLLTLGDFNARVGRDFELWRGVLGRHGIGNCNDNGRLLLEFCSKHQLVITNTPFQQKDRFKATWRHPRSKHWHLLD